MENARRFIVWRNSLELVFFRNYCGLSSVALKQEMYKNKGVWLIQLFGITLVNAGGIVPVGKYLLR